MLASLEAIITAAATVVMAVCAVYTTFVARGMRRTERRIQRLLTRSAMALGLDLDPEEPHA